MLALLPRHRPACRVLLWSAVSFVGLQLLLAVALECGPLRSVRDPEYATKEALLRDRIHEYPDRPLVVVLGSSRSCRGIDAGRLTRSAEPPALVFNFALAGAGPLLELVSLQRLLTAGLRPDLLLVEIHPALFNRTDANLIEETWLVGSRLSAEEICAISAHHTRPGQLWNRWARARLLPCFYHSPQLRRSLGVSAEPVRIDAHGWFPRVIDGFAPDDRDRQTGSAGMQYESAFGPFRLAAGAAGALRKIVKVCRAEGIPVALFLMPESERFRSFYTEDQRRGTEAFLRELARVEQAPLFDARDWISEDGFMDGHHLLPAGAARFTDRFGREVLAPCLQQTIATGASRMCKK